MMSLVTERYKLSMDGSSVVVSAGFWEDCLRHV